MHYVFLVVSIFTYGFQTRHYPRADKDATRIELTNVSSDILETILEYMRHHTTPPRSPADIQEIVKPIRALDMKKIVGDPWDADFVDSKTPKQIFDVILAANYMQIDPLLNLFCAKVATLIKNKGHEEIRALFAQGYVCCTFTITITTTTTTTTTTTIFFFFIIIIIIITIIIITITIIIITIIIIITTQYNSMVRVVRVPTFSLLFGVLFQCWWRRPRRCPHRCSRRRCSRRPRRTSRR